MINSTFEIGLVLLEIQVQLKHYNKFVKVILDKIYNKIIFCNLLAFHKTLGIHRRFFN